MSSRRTNNRTPPRRPSSSSSRRPSGPHAVKIIEIDAKGESFKLDEKSLHSVLSKVPSNMKVSIVSVVGAFRTGKSFVLDFMLRYLNATEGKKVNLSNEPDQDWMFDGGSLEGNHNKGGTKTRHGFGWRSGHERMTTGIWMWSEHFIRTLPNTREKVAVLVVDTQGMFDSTLGQMLTASIFGLSTLISSYQIYNVDKRIQEDNLQHLALFTEYGRVALQEDKKTSKKNDPEWYSSPDGETTGDGLRPFQRLEFLVRDWQHFDDEDGALKGMIDNMNVYLQEVLDERSQKDLREVRDQIHDCFESLSCFLLPHPGFDVTKANYDGDVMKIRESFRRLLSEYVRRIFSTRLTVKKIHGRAVSAMELFEFIRAYAKLFKEAKIFPEAKTLLAATSEANNRAALDVAVKNYKQEMDLIAGPNKIYCSESKLKKHHFVCKQAALAKFEAIATIGPRGEIRRFRQLMLQDVDLKYVDYKEANRLRDPFGFVAPYVVPIMVALLCYSISTVVGTVCGSSCSGMTSFLSNVYITIFSFMLFHILATGHGVRQRLGMMFSLVEAGAKAKFD